MEAITKTCLKILIDSQCREIEDEFKFLAAKFLKNVVMTSGPEHIARLQAFEAQMSAFEKTSLAKYLQ